jgi:dynactin 1
VGNYKATVDTLRQEKQTLLELQQGGEGEKNSMVVSSQKALSRAAQLVTEAANMRKQEAEAVMDHINQTKFKHMSNRLESMLPQNLASVELTTVKGEIMASAVCGKASHLLSGINSLFRKHIKPPLPDVNVEETSTVPFRILIPDELQQELHTTFHEADFGRVIAETAADIIRLLAAGQWPDLLSTEASTELGAIIGHTIQELDESFGILLKSLKEEGSLSVEQTSVGALQLSAQKTIQALRVEMERGGKLLIEPSWNPPGWALMRDIAIAKSTCLGAAASLSMIIDSNTQHGSTQSSLNLLYSSIEQSTSLVTSVDWQLRNLDILDSKQVEILSSACAIFLSESMSLMKAIKDLLISSGDLETCKAASTRTLRSISMIATELRSKVTNLSEGESYHPLSPEHDDHWRGVTALVRSIRSIDGDSEDVNFLLRAKAMEQRLSDAVENEPKLESATAKIASLESVRNLYLFITYLTFTNAIFYSCYQLARKNLPYRTHDFPIWKSLSRNHLRRHWAVVPISISELQKSTTTFKRKIVL